MSTCMIDTSVLEHLLNPDWNGDGHIHDLLNKLIEIDVCLGRDSRGRIQGEYRNRLEQRILAADEADSSALILRWAVLYAPTEEIEVDMSDALGKCIEPKMRARGAERSDQVIVYVAIRLNAPLISNNTKHINDLRTQLRKCAKRQGYADFDVFTSRQAFTKIVNN